MHSKLLSQGHQRSKTDKDRQTVKLIGDKKIKRQVTSSKLVQIGTTRAFWLRLSLHSSQCLKSIEGRFGCCQSTKDRKNETKEE